MTKEKIIALDGVLSALALALSVIDSAIPLTLLFPLPGIKLGLANLVTLYALTTLGLQHAFAILIVRCILGSLFAGSITSLLFSLCGGILALLCMWCLTRKSKCSLYGISIGGAAIHNIGQILIAILLLQSIFVLSYLPYLLLLSILTGSINAFLVFSILSKIKNSELS